jgi:hypothetical protein
VQSERFLEEHHVPQFFAERVRVSVPGHQHGRQIGACLSCRPDHLRARDTGHRVVDEEHIHDWSSANLQEIKCGAAIRCLYNLVAERLQVDGRDLAHLLLVVDDEHRPTPDRGFADVSCRLRLLRFGGAERPRDIDIHLGPCSRLASDPDGTARLAGETVHLAETKAGTFANLLRGEERLERLRQHLRRHALAAVGHRKGDVVAGSKVI